MSVQLSAIRNEAKCEIEGEEKSAVEVTVKSTSCHNVGHPNKVPGWIANSCSGHFLPSVERPAEPDGCSCTAQPYCICSALRWLAVRERSTERKGTERKMETNTTVRSQWDKTQSKSLANDFAVSWNGHPHYNTKQTQWSERMWCLTQSVESDAFTLLPPAQQHLS